jgi:hypothetical protein
MSDAKFQEVRDATDALKFLSQTHRALHDQRRKLEFQVLFTSISFYVFTGAARFSGKLALPTSAKFVVFVWVFCIGLSFAASVFLLRLHKANLRNITVAESAEDAIIQALSHHGLSLPSVGKQRSGWFFLGWLWQSIVVVFFAVACSLFLTSL